MHKGPHPNIVIGFDYSRSANRALRMALNLCGLIPGVRFHLVAALDPEMKLEGKAEDVDYQSASKLHERLRATADRLPKLLPMDNADVEVYARIGDPADVILQLAEEVEADLIVVGDHNESTLKEVLLGSTAEKVFHDSHAPVLCARPTQYDHDADMIELEPAGPPTMASGEPHVYSYEQNIAPTRPDEWPLY